MPCLVRLTTNNKAIYWTKDTDKCTELQTHNKTMLLNKEHWYTLQRQNTEISKQIFPEKEYHGLIPNFRIHASVSDLYIPTIGLPILLEEICRPILGLYKSLTDTWMWKLGRAALFPEKEYINGIFVAVHARTQNKETGIRQILCFA